MNDEPFLKERDESKIQKNQILEHNRLFFRYSMNNHAGDSTFHFREFFAEREMKQRLNFRIFPSFLFSQNLYTYQIWPLRKKGLRHIERNRDSRRLKK